MTPTKAQIDANINRVKWTLEDPTWVPTRQYVEKLFACYKEIADALIVNAQTDAFMERGRKEFKAHQVKQEVSLRKLKQPIQCLIWMAFGFALCIAGLTMWATFAQYTDHALTFFFGLAAAAGWGLTGLSSWGLAIARGEYE